MIIQVTKTFCYTNGSKIVTLTLSQLRKVIKMQLPRIHKDTKVHKEFIFNNLFLVQLRALVPWWQKNTFRSGLNI